MLLCIRAEGHEVVVMVIYVSQSVILHSSQSSGKIGRTQWRALAEINVTTPNTSQITHFLGWLGALYWKGLPISDKAGVIVQLGPLGVTAQTAEGGRLAFTSVPRNTQGKA